MNNPGLKTVQGNTNGHRVHGGKIRPFASGEVRREIIEPKEVEIPNPNPGISTVAKWIETMLLLVFVDGIAINSGFTVFNFCMAFNQHAHTPTHCHTKTSGNIFWIG